MKNKKPGLSKKERLKRRQMRKSNSAYAKLLNYVAVTAKLSWMPKDKQNTENPSLAWAVDLMGDITRKKSLHPLLYESFPRSKPNIDSVMVCLTDRLTRTKMQWYFLLEITIQEPSGETYVKGVDMVPDGDILLKDLQPYYHEYRQNLMDNINSNHKIVDIVWKAAKYCEDVEEKLKHFNPDVKIN